MTYDLHEEKIRVKLTADENGNMSAVLFFRNDAGEWAEPTEGQSLSFTNAYARELTGFPVKVMLRGEIIVDNGEWKGKRGGGRFLHCKPLSD